VTRGYSAHHSRLLIVDLVASSAPFRRCVNRNPPLFAPHSRFGSSLDRFGRSALKYSGEPPPVRQRAGLFLFPILPNPLPQASQLIDARS
jgi:hypothetical protein